MTPACGTSSARRNVTPDCHDHIDRLSDQIGRQAGQPIKMPFRPAVFDRNVFSLDVAGFAQALRSYAPPRGGLPASGRLRNRPRLATGAHNVHPVTMPPDCRAPAAWSTSPTWAYDAEELREQARQVAHPNIRLRLLLSLPTGRIEEL
jgi:hypothetical protein